MRIFISYGHDKHLDFAKKLAKAFENYSKNEHKYEVWVDKKNLRPGKPWADDIETGLKWVAEDINGRMILIMTPHSVRRPDGYCLNELAYALDLHLSVLPIMLVWTTPPLSIYRYQWLDMTNSCDNDNLSTFESDFNKIIEAIEKENFYQDENQARLERLMEPLDYSADIRYYLPSFVGREWLLDKVNSWIKDNNGSRIFLLTGLPGVGKTAFTIKLIQTFDNVVAFHLIRRGDSEKTSLKRAICSIAFQLSKQLPDFYERIIQTDIYLELNRCNELALFDVLISTPLWACQERVIPILIIIDAIDESLETGSNFALFISEAVQKLPTWVRFILTSRPEEAVILPLQAYSPHILDPRANENNNDICHYVENRIMERYNNVTIDYRRIIQESIVERSEGNFLYAEQICNILPKEANDFDATHLPEGIKGVYSIFFVRTFPDIEYYRKFVRPILEVLISQVEPFSVDCLADCLNINKDDIWDFLNKFRTFITEDRGKIRPFHSSLFDWLSQRELSGPYEVEPKNGVQAIARWLYKKFEESGWNFFNNDTNGQLIETWMPAILKKTSDLSFDSSEVISNYLKQLNGKKILQDLVPNPKRFYFIKGVLQYIFKQVNFRIDILNEEINCKGTGIDRHLAGLRYLYEYTRYGKVDLPQMECSQSEFNYFLNIQLPMFYVQSSYDTDYIFKSLAYGLVYAFHEEGRGPNMNSIFKEIYNLATFFFPESGHIAVKYLKEVAPLLKTDFEDIWANRAEQNARRICDNLKEKGYCLG